MDDLRLIVPLITPFTDDGSAISEIRVARVVRWHKERGAEGFMVGSEAGEYTSLGHAERKEMLEWVMREAGGSPVYLNVTSTTTPSAIDLCQEGHEWGMAGGVVTSPYPGGHTVDEMTRYYKAIRRFGNMPCGFLDGSGKYQGVLEDESLKSGTVACRSFGEKDLSEMDCLGAGSMECWTPRGMAHPVGIFGADVGQKLLAKWSLLKGPVSGIIKAYGAQRVGKYVLEKGGLEIGAPRAPFGRLEGKGQELVDELLKMV